MNSLRVENKVNSPERNQTPNETEAQKEENDRCRNSITNSLSTTSTLSMIKKGAVLQAMWGLLADYSNKTSIHGIKYFGARNQPWIDRLFWLFVVGLSMYICISLTMTTCSRWYNNPVIVSLAESNTPVWEIPFPTVTICPLAKSRREQFDFGGFLNTDRELPESEKYKFEALTHVCLINSNLFKGLTFSDNFTESELPQTLRQLAPQIEDTFETVKWRRSILNSTTVLTEVLTDDGLCFSFNALHDSEIFRNWTSKNISNAKENVWNLESGYKTNAGINAYPRRVLAGDVDEAYNLILKGRYSNSDPYCSGKSQGFKVILHTPGEFPQVSKRFFRVPYKQIILVSIKPNMITTSFKVRTYDPEKRQCFFDSERYLKYFKIYTQGNCEHECLTNATLDQCGCVKFSMPKNNETKYCGAGKIECYVKIRKQLLKSNGYRTNCNCLPECTSIAYDAEVTQSLYDDSLDKGLLEEMENDTDVARSIMNVFFESNNFLSAKRSELYGIADLIANIGGLFGLFMGVSILSLVEILYFCTIRLTSTLLMRNKHKHIDKNYQN